MFAWDCVYPGSWFGSAKGDLNNLKFLLPLLIVSSQTNFIYLSEGGVNVGAWLKVLLVRRISWRRSRRQCQEGDPIDELDGFYGELKTHWNKLFARKNGRQGVRYVPVALGFESNL